MKIPLYRLLSLLSVPLALCGCLRSPDEPSPEDKPREAQITLTLHTEPVRSKALYGALDDAQERAVRDLSLYLFHRSVPEASQRLYIANPSGSVSLRLIHGDYDLLALANTGADPGEMTLDELEAYRLDVMREADLTARNALVMSARKYLHVDSDEDIPVTLERCAVRLDLNVTLAESCPAGLALHSVSLRNVAGCMTPFGENRPDVKKLLSPYGGLSLSGERRFERCYYLYENLRGENPAIRSQAERDLSRAPKGATLVHIEASYGGRPLNYYVFLGGNTSTDFNLRRNHRYTVEVNILGPSDVDTRVSTTDLLVDEAPAAGHNLSQIARMILIPVCTNDPDAEMTLRYTLLEGTGSLAIDDLTIFPGGFRTVRPNEPLEVTYLQKKAGPARIRFTLTDAYGSSVSREVSTTYSPLAIAYTVDESDRTSGRVEIVFSLEADMIGEYPCCYDSATTTGSSLVSLGGSLLFPGNAFTVGDYSVMSAECPLSFSFSDSYTGRFTFGDCNGNTRTFEIHMDKTNPVTVTELAP